MSCHYGTLRNAILKFSVVLSACYQRICTAEKIHPLQGRKTAFRSCRIPLPEGYRAAHVIDTHVVSDRRHVILFFADGTWQTYRRVEVEPRTWWARLRKLVRVWV